MKLLPETLARHAERVRQQHEQMELPNFPPPATLRRSYDLRPPAQTCKNDVKNDADPLGR